MKKLIAEIEKIVSAKPGEHGAEADKFLVQTNMQTGKLRLTLYDKAGLPLAHYNCIAPDAYDLGARVMRGYDRLEGLS